MGVPNSDVCYTSVITGRGAHEVLKEHVVALKKKYIYIPSDDASVRTEIRWFVILLQNQ
jgi:hypothetical protein